jgi:hypothetical protein
MSEETLIEFEKRLNLTRPKKESDTCVPDTIKYLGALCSGAFIEIELLRSQLSASRASTLAEVEAVATKEREKSMKVIGLVEPMAFWNGRKDACDAILSAIRAMKEGGK